MKTKDPITNNPFGLLLKSILKLYTSGIGVFKTPSKYSDPKFIKKEVSSILDEAKKIKGEE